MHIILTMPMTARPVGLCTTMNTNMVDQYSHRVTVIVGWRISCQRDRTRTVMTIA
jgi:hypothetical protein